MVELSLLQWAAWQRGVGFQGISFVILRQLLYCENNLELYKGWLLLCVSSRTQTGFLHTTNVLHFTQQLHLHTCSFMYNYFYIRSFILTSLLKAII